MTLERPEIERLERQLERYVIATKDILELAREHEQFTIEKVMGTFAISKRPWNDGYFCIKESVKKLGALRAQSSPVAADLRL